MISITKKNTLIVLLALFLQNGLAAPSNYDGMKGACKLVTNPEAVAQFGGIIAEIKNAHPFLSQVAQDEDKKNFYADHRATQEHAGGTLIAYRYTNARHYDNSVTELAGIAALSSPQEDDLQESWKL